MSHHLLDRHTVTTRFWHNLGDGRIQCDLCPRFCKLHAEQRGLCFIRAHQSGQIVMTSYGRSSGFVVDPIEKKPLNHFFPGSSVLSFGTAGCNLACKFCQNWDISKAREMDTLQSAAEPEKIAKTAEQLGCASVAFTYNDPVIFHEYAIDTALACRELGIKSVAVSAGYVCAEPRAEFYQYMDAVNIDLKAFNERFYHKITGSHLEPVLETLQYIKRKTQVWLEITNLLIPGENDSDNEIASMTHWVVENLGVDVPLHFTAFHPDWKMTDKPRTPSNTLLNARKIALNNGIRYAYVGNIHDKTAQSTYCYQCGNLLIGRSGYNIFDWQLQADATCTTCNAACVGHYKAKPDTWGANRAPVDLT